LVKRKACHFNLSHPDPGGQSEDYTHKGGVAGIPKGKRGSFLGQVQKPGLWSKAILGEKTKKLNVLGLSRGKLIGGATKKKGDGGEKLSAQL